jgi:hypothetical protein
MKIWRTRKSRDTHCNLEQDSFFSEVERTLIYLSEEDKEKLRFSKEFVSEAVPFQKANDTKIVLGPMDIKIFELFIFSILVEYDYQKLI